MQIRRTQQLRYGAKFIGIALLVVFFSLDAYAQNMPYSQRALGDPVHSRNLLNTGMGGVSQAYSDAQTLNFVNPASYASLRLTTLDAGLNVGTFNLHDQDTASFHSGFGSLSYLQIGVPLKKNGGWGLVFGLTPETKVNYRISKTDSLESIGKRAYQLYEGNGGSYKAFVGTGYGIKGFRIGVNVGYLFGSKKSSLQTLYPDDSMALFNTHSRERTGYGAFFADAGVQADIKLENNLILKLGASAGLQSDLKGKRDYLLETFNYTGGSSDRTPKNQDTAYFATDEEGTIVYPAHYGVGFLLQNTKGKGSWSVGADYEATAWSTYRYYGSGEGLRDSRSLRFGAQFVPSTKMDGGYWSRVAYRVGYYNTQKNYESNQKGVNEYAFSLGFGLPARNHVRSNQFTLINLALEVGKRGTDQNELNASFVRVSLGFSLSDLWFIERKYQ